MSDETKQDPALAEKQAELQRLFDEIGRLDVPWSIALWDGESPITTSLAKGRDASLSVVLTDSASQFSVIISMRVLARAMALVCGFVEDATKMEVEK